MQTCIRRSRAGNYSVLTAISLVVLAGFGALAIDISVARVAQVEMKNATEAGAHAGARMLDGTAAGVAAAKEAAVTVTAENPVLGAAPSIAEVGGADGQVEVGHWADGSFTLETEPQNINAVRVHAWRGDIRTFLRRFIDPEATLATQARSVAVAGGLGASGCPFPIAIPSCLVDTATMCNNNVAFGPDNGDNGAWATIGEDRPSASSIRAALGSCAEQSSVEDEVSLNNGQVASASMALADAVAASADSWDAEWGALPARSASSGVPEAEYGAVLKGQVIVFSDPSNCTATKYEGTNLDIVGYMQVAIYDVDTTGAAADRQVRWHSYCEMSRGTTGGGWYGATVYPSLAE